ncbi:MAG: GTP cyclohydrolase II RibA [Rhodovibrio sp.]|nr:GTP cyclohydrolase II RibA [Rhodovibrio sp.]
MDFKPSRQNGPVRGAYRAPAHDGTTERTRVAIPLRDGVTTEFITFHNLPDGKEHFAVQVGRLQAGTPPLVRIHSECVTGDVFGSLRCDCGEQLREAIELLEAHGGLLLYLRQEGRGIGLVAKIDSYLLQDRGLDTYEANEALNFERDARTYDAAAAMLLALDVQRVRLLTNNPCKVQGLKHAGVEVVEQFPTSAFRNAHNERYIDAKISKGDHRYKDA